MSDTAIFTNWSVLFETEDGMTHPVRYDVNEPVHESEIRKSAIKYMLRKNKEMGREWLRNISDIYPRTQ